MDVGGATTKSTQTASGILGAVIKDATGLWEFRGCYKKRNRPQGFWGCHNKNSTSLKDLKGCYTTKNQQA